MISVSSCSFSSLFQTVTGTFLAVVHFPNCNANPTPRPKCIDHARYYLLSDADREEDDKRTGRKDEWEMRKKVANEIKAAIGKR